MGIELAKALVVVGADNSRLPADFRKSQTITKTAMTKLASISRSAMAAVGLSIAGITVGFVKAISFAANFEQEMINVRANARLLGSEGEEAFQKLVRIAREMGATTRFTAGQAALALNQLALGGLSAGEAAKALPNVLDLAASGNLGLAESAKIVVDNMVKFGLVAGDTARIGDVLSSAQSRAQVTARDLADSHLALGGIAAAMGATFEDVTAILVGMGKAGTNMRLAGTAIGRALSRLAGKPKDTKEAMEELGIVMEDFTRPGGGVDIIPLFREIANKLPTDPIKRGAMAMKLFGERGRAIIGVLTLMTRGRFVEDVRKGFEDDIGRSAEVTAAKFDTFKGAMLEFISALGELSIAVFPVIKPITLLTDVIKELALGVSGIFTGVGIVFSKIKEGLFGAGKEAEDTKTSIEGIANTKKGMDSLVDTVKDLGVALDAVVIPDRFLEMSLSVGRYEKAVGDANKVLDDLLARRNRKFQRGDFNFAGQEVIDVQRGVVSRIKAGMLAKEAANTQEFLELFGGFEEAGEFIDGLVSSLLDLRPVTDMLAEFDSKLQQAVRLGEIDIPEAKKLFRAFLEESALGESVMQLEDLREELDFLRRDLSETEIEIERFNKASVGLKPERKAEFADLIRERAKILEDKRKADELALEKPDTGFGRVGFAQFGQRIQDIILKNDPQKRAADAAEAGVVAMGHVKEEVVNVVKAVKALNPNLE